MARGPGDFHRGDGRYPPGGGGRPAGARPGGPRGPAPKPVSPAEALAAKAEQLHKSTGVPMDIARQVAAGKLDLNDAIKRMAFRDEVEGLIARHGLDRALATQVALGQAELERVLRQRRVAVHLAENAKRDSLEAALAAGTEVVLGLHGRALVTGKLSSLGPYEIQFRNVESGETVTVHKTRVKFLCEAAAWQKARKSMSWDAVRKAESVEPILRPQDRYALSNRRLGDVQDRKLTVRVSCLEGEVFSGEVAWVARWEIGLAVKGASLVIFRHSIVDFTE